ncbi:hypothetical protein Q7P37_010518 [Cladosporium fusiforme]
MGWWPFSSSDPSPTTTGQNDNTPAPKKRDFSLTDEQHLRVFGRPRQDFGSSSSREQQADAELNAFLKEIGAAPEVSKTTDTTAASASAPADGGVAPPAPEAAPKPSNVDDAGRRIHPDGSLDITPEALYPRTMSCRQAFDQAFYCQSLGGKFNDIYRHGHLNSCSEQWGAFWFCMRVRQYSEEDKQKVVVDYYKDREERKKKEFGSSEDVWELRTKGVDKAFWKDPNGDDGDVAVKE